MSDEQHHASGGPAAEDDPVEPIASTGSDTDAEVARDLPPDVGMRAAGFLLTVGGALLAGIGSMLDWATVTAPGYDTLTPTYRGVDLLEGKIALGLAVVALVAVLVSRLGATAAVRRFAAALVLIAGIGLVALAGGEAITAGSRIVDDFVAPVREASGDAAADELASILEAELGVGIWLTLAGGLILAAGGLVTLAWTSRARDDGPATDGSAD